MKRSILDLLLLLVLVSSPLGARDPSSLAWENLRGIAPGSSVRVMQTDTRQESGRFAGFDETSVSLDTERGRVVISRADVARIRAKKGPRRKRILLGAAIGAGAGVGIGLAGASAGDIDIRRDIVAGFGAAAGAAIGAGVGAAWPSYRTIYRAP